MFEEKKGEPSLSEYEGGGKPSAHINNIRHETFPIKLPEEIDRSKLAFLKIGGGVGPNSIGANSYYYGDQSTRFAVDAGERLGQFGNYRHLIPDVRELERMHALFYTHAHIDHIGAIPHFPALDVRLEHTQVYGMPEVRAISKLGAIMGKMPISGWLKFNADPAQNCNLDPGGITRVGDWMVEARHIRHSINSRGFLMTAPNGVKILHTGDMRMSAGTEDDADYHQQIMNIGAVADFVVMDVTHSDLSGSNQDVSSIRETYDEYFKTCEGARVNVATLSSALPTLDSFMDSALQAGRTVIFHGFYAASSAKLFKQAGHKYSDLESALDSRGLPRVMDSEDPRAAMLAPENTVIIMTGQYMEQKSKFMEFARGDFKPKYRIPPPNIAEPHKEIFCALRGPYPNMRTEWSNMQRGIEYITKFRGWRMDMHGIDAGPWRDLREKYPQVNFREFSAGGHCKFDEMRLFLSLLSEGARKAGRPAPVAIPHHTDFRGLDKIDKIFTDLRYPHQIVLPGQTAVFSLSKDRLGRLERNVHIASDSGVRSTLIGALPLGLNNKGNVDLEKEPSIFGGPFQYDLLEWNAETDRYEVAETLVTPGQAQDFIDRVRAREGFSPYTYKSHEAMLRYAGLGAPLADFMQIPERKVEVQMRGAFFTAAGRTENMIHVSPVYVPVSSDIDGRKTPENKTPEAVSAPPPKPTIRIRLDRDSGDYVSSRLDTGLTVRFNDQHKTITVYSPSTERGVRIIQSTNAGSLEEDGPLFDQAA